METELVGLLAILPAKFEALSRLQLREQNALGQAVLRFWDLALGALSPAERGLHGTIDDQVRRALETQQLSNHGVVRESARIGLARLAGEFPG